MHSRDYRGRLDYVILGGGPAGVQLGYFLQKSGMFYIILEAREMPGTFFSQFPRHRKLISINKIHCGTSNQSVQFRWDWNSLLNDDCFSFKQYSTEYFPPAEALLKYLSDFVSRFKLQIEYGCRIGSISKSIEGFALKSDNGDVFLCKRLIVATGVSEPFVPSIPGIELAEQYASADLRPGRFENRKVLIIGKGNSGFETADALIPFAAQIHVVSPSPVHMAWNTHHVGHLRAVNNNLIDTDLLKGQNATIWGSILSIERRRMKLVVRISHADSHNRIFTHEYDHIICCTGFKMSVVPFETSARPEMTLNDRFPKLTERWESVNVPDLFFAGCLTQARDFKRSSSAFIHGFRYNSRALFNMLNEDRFIPWPSEIIPRTACQVTNIIMERINTTSSLWHQFNFLVDIIDIEETEIHYFKGVPIDYARTAKRWAGRLLLLLSFTHDKPTNVALRANFSKEPALHPRLMLIDRGSVISEHHMYEDLEAEWYEETLYIAPLEEYLRQVLSNNRRRPQSLTTTASAAR
jgi:thioredoxin reductase